MIQLNPVAVVTLKLNLSKTTKNEDGKMAIEHQMVTFVTTEEAMSMIWSKKKDDLKTANPLPKYPGEKASDEKKEAFRMECGRIDEKIDNDLEKVMATVKVVKEQGHPDLPDDHVVRSRTKNRCRFVGCESSVKKSGAKDGGTKANRHASAFCKKHLHLRRQTQIPRKKGFFVLRIDSEAGLRVAE